MDLGLKGATALVTGGSRGIGLATARAFAAEGCNLHLVARGEDALKAARAAILASHRVDVTIHALDLSRGDNARTLMERCPDIDILVNNAGAIPAGDLEAIDEARWRAAWDLKVFGYINLTRACLPCMRARGHGVIVNVIGLAGEMPTADYVCGSAGNAALMAFTRAVGARSVDFGVRVLGVNPTRTATDRLVTLARAKAADHLGDAERWRETLTDLPFGRPADPEEVGDVVVFLASPRCSYVSGSVVTVDGGALHRR